MRILVFLVLIGIVIIPQTVQSNADFDCSVTLSSALEDAQKVGDDLSPIAKDWYDSCMTPEFESSTANPENAIDSHLDVGTIYLDWIGTLQNFGITGDLSAEISQGDDFLLDGIKKGIKGWNERCATENNSQRVRDLITWYSLAAQQFDSQVDFFGNNIDLTSVAQDSCARIEFDIIAIPNTIKPGDTENPTIKVGVKTSENNPTIFSEPILVETRVKQVGGSTISDEAGQTSLEGFIFPSITMPPGETQILVTVSGTWIEWFDIFPSNAVPSELTKSTSFLINSEPESCDPVASVNFRTTSTCDTQDPLPNLDGSCVSQGFEDRYTDGFHKGLDLRANEGTKVFSVHSGTVDSQRFGYDSKQGWHVWINSDNGIDSTGYFYLQEKPLVLPGQTITTGQQIGNSGTTGIRIEEPHLEIQYEIEGNAVNPETLISEPKECQDDEEADLEAEISSTNTVEISGSFDPNEKVSSQGFGNLGHIKEERTLFYTNFFENLPEATAEALKVVVVDELDSNLDWSTFKTLDSSHPDNLSTDFDESTGTATWTFNDINLPPNKNPPEGEGWVSFQIDTLPNLTSGTEIRNKASIFFDFNPAIITNEVINTIDKNAPTSSVSSLPAESPTTFDLSWSGNDIDAGIKSYTIFVSENDGPFKIWLQNINKTSSTFSGNPGASYSFFSIATDNVGNKEVKSFPQPESNTRISLDIPCSVPSSGNWIVSSNCTMTQNETAPENVIVSNGATLTVPNGVILEIDFANHNLTIESGGNVIIESGGTIQ